MRSSPHASELDRHYALLVKRWSRLDDSAQKALLDAFAIDFSYHSGGLENEEITLHDTREVFDHDSVSSFTGDLRTIFEMANLKSMWVWTMQNMSHGFSFDEKELLRCHEILTHGTYDQRRWELGERPGQYKHHMFEVADGVGDYPEDVQRAVAATLSEVREALAGPHDHLGTVSISAYAHAMLVDIHPFADGNGRVARQLSNMVLLTDGLPPVLVPKEDRMAYFGALDAFHNDDDLTPLREFLVVETLKCWSDPLATPC